MVSGRYLFHQAILMGGSDLCEWSFVDRLDITYYDRSNPREFAKDLGRMVSLCTIWYFLQSQNSIHNVHIHVRIVDL